MTVFDDIVDFNYNFGVIDSKELIPKVNVFNEEPENVKRCMDLIREEMDELEDAVKNKDLIETCDALGDLIYVICGFFCRMGINSDKAMKLIHDNNMSKLCLTEEEAIDTVQWYKENKLDIYDSPDYRLAPDEKHYVVFNKSTNKILKSIKWKDVDLTSCLEV